MAATVRDRNLAHARWSARAALLCVAGALAVVIAVVSYGGVLDMFVGLAGLVVAGAALWWGLAHRGPTRLVALVVAVAAPVAVLALYIGSGVWLAGAVALACWAAAIGFAHVAQRKVRGSVRMQAHAAPRPRRAVLIMNPLSGGGKVERFALAERARALGAQVILLDTGRHVDVAELARRAVADGADLLGVAAGDGTQALVAAVAAEHGLPFLVVPAGTRNHFAMDLGLDRSDPSRSLDALEDGEEFVVDLGDVAGRPFVNTVSFGAYAEIVQSPAYRDAKAGTTLDALPDVLLSHPEARLRAQVDGRPVEGQQALLVSNNAYAGGIPVTAARRPRLDGGVLGVVAVRVDGPAQAAELVVLGARASGLQTSIAHEVVVRGEREDMAVAVDGEALRLHPPVVCRVRPGALRVRVPLHRPDAPEPIPPTHWGRIVGLAFGREGSAA